MLLFFAAGYSGDICIEAYASVGTVNGRSYDDFDDLIDAVEDLDGETITIEMSGNWDAAEDEQFDERLIIPKNSRATLNMHGWVFDRNRVNNNDSKSNGELICVESGASLTVNGGAEKTLHIEPVYDSTSIYDTADEIKNFYGGVLTGGNSTNGAGGIHLKSHTSLTLNAVTLAGCRADRQYGGGIHIADDDVKIRLNDSTITGCYSYVDGGAIYAGNDDDISITLVNSHIDENYCREDGGAIRLNGEKVLIKGDGNSSISRNGCEKRAGAIFLGNDDASVIGTGSGLKIEGNRASSSGAIRIEEENIVLSNLIIRDNLAQGNGSIIYVINDLTTIHDCTITDNTGGGGAVRAYGSHNLDNDPVNHGFIISGRTIIRDNNYRGEARNLVLADDTCRVMLNLRSGADVHISYDELPEEYFMITEGSAGDSIKNGNCLSLLTADQNGYHLTYNSAPNYRKLFFVKDGYSNAGIVGEEYQPKSPVKETNIAPAAAGRAAAGGDKSDSGQYDLIRGYFMHPETNGTEDKFSAFYYTDGLFFGSGGTVNASYTYNDHLAAASMAMAYSGMYLAASGREDANNNTYYNKHAGARQFLADIGCPDQNIYVSDSNLVKPGTDSIGVTIASKKLRKRGTGGEAEDSGYVLIPVVTRGGGYEAEIAGSLTIGTASSAGGEHQGFSQAADQIMSEIDYYIARYGLEDELAAGKVKFWVAGYSRGGSVANIVSKRLVEKYAEKTEGQQNEVFGYTFEAAGGGADKAEKTDPANYFCIHNVVNPADIVPLLGFAEMGLKRYGVDHYIPGTGVLPSGPEVSEKSIDPGHSGDGSITTVTTYADNLPFKTKSNEYEQLSRPKMEEQLLSIDSGMVFDDYFHPMAEDFMPSDIYETGNYNGTCVEDFLVDFVSFLQEGNGREDWTALPGRNQYSTYSYSLNGTISPALQRSLRNASVPVLGAYGDGAYGITGRTASLLKELSHITDSLGMVDWNDFYRRVIGSWYQRSEADKERYINLLWNCLTDTGVFDGLTQSEVSNIRKNWPAIADAALRFIDADYNVHPGDKDHNKSWAGGSGRSMMYTPTFMTFADSILMNHYPEVTLAWLRASDDYYDSEKDEYTVDLHLYNPDPPTAKAGEKPLENGQAYYFRDDLKITLDVENLKGEAIYYSLKERNKDGDYIDIGKNRLYRGGIDLIAGTEDTYYDVSAYAMSYGRISTTMSFGISLASGRHEVTVDHGITGYPQSFSYREGESVKLTALSTGAYSELNGKYFSRWKITEGGRDVTKALLGDDDKAKDPVIEFEMPEAGNGDGSPDSAWPVGYALRIDAVYKDSIRSLRVTELDAPLAGQKLDETATVTFDDGSESGITREYPLIWSYLGEGLKPIPASGGDIAYGQKAYEARINVEADRKSGIVFNSTVNVRNANEGTETFTINFADGSLLFSAGRYTTQGDDTTPEPVPEIMLTVNEIDLNTEAQDVDTEPAEYSLVPGSTVTLTAPEVEDEVFVRWDVNNGELGSTDYSGDAPVFTGSGITLADGYSETDRTIKADIPSDGLSDELSIDALYMPVIREVRAEIDEPEAGKALAKAAKLSLKISNEYELSPEFIGVTWTPSSETAGYLTGYTATVKAVPKVEDGVPYVKVRKAGTQDEYEKRNAYFIYSENLKTTINNDEGVICDTADNSVSKTFEPIYYELVSVRQPDSISGLPHGTNPASVLPKSTAVIRNDGSEVSASVQWGTPVKESSGGDQDETVWSVSGSVVLPAGIRNSAGISLAVSMKISVSGADTVSAPRSSLESGRYITDQIMTLSTATEGAEIYYTINGGNATTQSRRYEGEAIEIKRENAVEILDAKGNPTGEKAVTVRAIAVKSGMRGSAEASWQYIFSSKMPETISARVTFMVENGAWDDGTSEAIEVILSGFEGDRLKLSAADIPYAGSKPDKGYKEGSWDTAPDTDTEITGDTTYTYTYAEDKAEEDIISINNAPVALSAASFTYNGRVQKPAVKTIGGRTLRAGTDYTIKWSADSPKDAGTYTLTVTGRGSYSGTATAVFRINKAANPLKIRKKTARIKYSKIRRKAQKLKVTRVIRFRKKTNDRKTYKLVSARKGGRSYKKYFRINKRTGRLTVRKGLRKGTYKVKVKVKAAGNRNYRASAAKKLTFKIKVK